MADVFDPKKRSSVMRQIRSKHSKPELIVRSALHARGLRFRLHASDLPGKPDIVFRKAKVAVQVRGCFWHHHSCMDGHIPKSRKSYWGPKISGNVARDRRNDRWLRRMGWSLFVLWECQCVKPKKLEPRIDVIERKVRQRLEHEFD